jgi:cytochrome c peroxidase
MRRRRAIYVAPLALALVTLPLLQPPINPNEMANDPEGPYPPLAGGYSPLLVQKLASRPYTLLFKQVYGHNAFHVYTPKQIYELFGEALAAYQSSSLGRE